MSSRKYEKSFWKINATALPGRTPNLSSAANSFRDYNESVSDAWDIEKSTQCSVSTPSSSSLCPPTSVVSHSVSSISPNPLPTPSSIYEEESSFEKSSRKAHKMEVILEESTVDIEALSRLSWSGIPCSLRSKVWKILCGYLPGNSNRCADVVARKRDEYFRYVTRYFHSSEEALHEETYRQISIDIPRMSPVLGLFQQRVVQEIFERILYIWAVRHPASGYVQGINDLLTPFFLIFLQEHFPNEDFPNLADINVETDVSKEDRIIIEADSFWCLSKVLEGIQDNYTFAQPGIQGKVKMLEELIMRVDVCLHEHLVAHDVLYLQFAFRWMNNLLMREIPMKAAIRLWDTYLSEGNDGFSHFHLYVTAAFLIHWKGELLKKNDFHTLLMFLQNLPTAKWGDSEISLIVAEAFKLSYLFSGAPNHLTSSSSSSF